MYVYDTVSGRTRRFANWNDAYRAWFHSENVGDYEYYLHSLQHGWFIPFKTKRELLDYWHTKVGHGFDMLNMTGYDLYRTEELRGDRITITYWRRPYEVLDNHGRHIDIREWSGAEIPIPKNFNRYYGHSGRRDTQHRKNGPSLYRAAKRDETAAIDACRDHGYSDKLRMRKRTQNIDAWSYYEKAHAVDWTSSKCWKDQSKSPKQYWRHRKGIKTISIATEETNEELIARLNTEFGLNRDNECSTEYISA